MMYYIWAGVGAIEDLERDSAVDITRAHAIALFCHPDFRTTQNLTLWERDGANATLLAVATLDEHGDPVFTIFAT